MADCESLIKKDIDINCDTPVTRGLEANAVIINRSDIDFAKSVFATGKSNVLEDRKSVV